MKRFYSGPIGGYEGEDFNLDLADNPHPTKKATRITEIKTWVNYNENCITRIAIVLDNGEVLAAGGSGGDIWEFAIDPSYQIVCFDIFTLQKGSGRVSGLQMWYHKSAGSTDSPVAVAFGRGSPSKGKIYLPEKGKFEGFIGRSGTAIDALGIISSV